ncbi:hypothetical protein JW766_04605 [Candidatus Dojkabacteria bacterium]|nr:hypothetical protein [Candidatus Dojkabacteria bacterium]
MTQIAGAETTSILTEQLKPGFIDLLRMKRLAQDTGVLAEGAFSQASPHTFETPFELPKGNKFKRVELTRVYFDRLEAAKIQTEPEYPGEGIPTGETARTDAIICTGVAAFQYPGPGSEEEQTVEVSIAGVLDGDEIAKITVVPGIREELAISLLEQISTELAGTISERLTEMIGSEILKHEDGTWLVRSNGQFRASEKVAELMEIEEISQRLKVPLMA